MPTNRLKAVIMISISAIFYIVFGSLSKYSMNVKQVQAFDIVLARGVVVLILSTIITLITGTSFKVGPG